MKIRVLFLCLCLLIVGCGKKENAPEKAPEAPSSTPPPTEASTLIVPIEIPLASVAKQAEEKVPKVLKQKNYAGEPEGIKFTVTRGSIGLSASGANLSMKIPVSFKAEVKPKLGGKRRGPLRRNRSSDDTARLNCSASLNLTFNSTLEVGPDWKLKAKVTPGTRSWSQPCEMTKLKIDVSKKIDEKLDEKIKEIVGIMEKKLANAGDIHGKIENAWNALHEVRPVGDKFFLAMHPESIALGPLEGKGNTMVATASILAHPRLYTSPPTKVEKRPLPSNSGKIGGGGFHIAIEVSLPFSQATQEMKAKMMGKDVEAEGKKAKVSDARIYGNGDNFVVEIQLEEPIGATVSLAGRPQYDPASGEMRVKDLDFFLNTQSLLAKSADWLLHGVLQRAMADKAKFPLGEKIAEAKTNLEAGLNKPLNENANLVGKVSKLEPKGIYVTKDAFLVVVVAEGEMSMKVR